MAATINGICDGVTYSHSELQTIFGFKNVRNFKDFISEHEIPYTVVGYQWFIAGEDVRRGLRHAAKTATERKAERADDKPAAKPKAKRASK